MVYYCERCGWGICVFANSEMYQKLRIKHDCPYCKVATSRLFSIIRKLDDADQYMKIVQLKEPVRLRFPIPKKTRIAVMSRDGHKCSFCGATERLELDHILPVASGGTNDIENLRVLCKRCNARRVFIDDEMILRELREGWSWGRAKRERRNAITQKSER